MDKESVTMGRVIAAILLVVVLVVGGGIIANTAYQAGLSTAVTTATGSGGAVVAPVVVPVAGWGAGWGWSPFGWFFGFLATLFFVFLVFGLIRAIVWGGRHGHRGWGGPGYRGGNGGWSDGGGSGHGRSPWEARAHETFEDWHRRAHGETPDAGRTDPPTTPTGAG
jgi:hypothetical protein